MKNSFKSTTLFIALFAFNLFTHANTHLSSIDEITISQITYYPISCYGGTGGLDISASGGSGNYQYSIDNGETWQVSGSFSNLVADTYAVLARDVSDSALISDVSLAVLEEPDQLIIDLTVSEPDCNNQNGAIEADVMGGTKWSTDYEYSWLPGRETTSGIANLGGGEYSLNVYDANGCSAYVDVSLVKPFTPTLSSISPVCDGTTTLGAQLPPNATWGYWSIVQGSGAFEDASSATTEVTDLGHGLNIFSWTIVFEGGCEQTTTIEVVNNQPSKAEIVGGISSVRVCDSEYDLHAVAPTYGEGKWYLMKGGATIMDEYSEESKVINLSLGENKFRWVVTNNGCVSMTDLTVINLQVEVEAGRDTAVCSGVAQLNATAAPQGMTGHWSVANGSGGGIFNPSSSAPTTTITSLEHGQNTLVWNVVNNGCVSNDTVVVFNDKPYRVSATSFIYTDGENTTLRAENPPVGDGQWTLLEGTGIISEPSNSTTVVSNLLPGNNYFRWRVTNNMCSEYVDVVVQSGVLPMSDAGLDQVLCVDSTELQANEPRGTYGKWSVRRGSGTIDDVNSAVTKVYDISPGRNVFDWTLYYAGGTSNYSVDSVVIVNDKPYPVNVTPYINTTQECEILTADPLVVGTGMWQVLSGSDNIVDFTNSTTEVCELEYGDNYYRWYISNNDCVDYADVTIKREIPTTIEDALKDSKVKLFPNPIKDDLYIESEIGVEQVVIYSTSGELVLQSDLEGATQEHIKLSELLPGVYVVQLKRTDSVVITKKVVKE